jgi:hypothetical protein
VKRTRRKPRAAGTGCQAPKCRGYVFREVGGIRCCPKHAADRLVGNAVRARDGGACRRCGAPPPEGSVNDWAHVHPRSMLSIRWIEANSLTRCRRCHTYMGMPGRRLDWERFFRAQGVPWDELRERAFADPPGRPLEVIERYDAAALP